MRAHRTEVEGAAEVEAAIRKAQHEQRARSWHWEVEREGVWFSASMNAYGGLDIRCINGEDRDRIAIPSALVEDFARFVGVLYPEAAWNGATGPDPDEEERMLAEARPAPRPVPPHTPGQYPTNRLTCPQCGAWMERETATVAAFACGESYLKADLKPAEASRE